MPSDSLSLSGGAGPEAIIEMTVKYVNPNSKRLCKGEGAVPPWVQQMKESGALKRLSNELSK